MSEKDCPTCKNLAKACMNAMIRVRGMEQEVKALEIELKILELRVKALEQERDDEENPGEYKTREEIQKAINDMSGVNEELLGNESSCLNEQESKALLEDWVNADPETVKIMKLEASSYPNNIKPPEENNA